MYSFGVFKTCLHSHEEVSRHAVSAPRDIPRKHTSEQNHYRERKQTPDSVMNIFGDPHFSLKNYTLCSKKQWARRKNCGECNAKFTILKRRHHCRSCGTSVCSKCSGEHRLDSTSLKMIRLCRKCDLRLFHHTVEVDTDCKLPDSTIQLNPLQDSIELEECSVCLEYLEDQTGKCNVKTLECGHSFHYNCISSWFDRSSLSNTTVTCPLCRVSASWTENQDSKASGSCLQKTNVIEDHSHSYAQNNLSELDEEQQMALALQLSISDQ